MLVMLLGGGVPTINFRVDFLRPAVSTALLGTGRLRRAGRTIGVVDVDVHDAEGRLVAVGRGCYSTAPDGPRCPAADDRARGTSATWSPTRADARRAPR